MSYVVRMSDMCSVLHNSNQCVSIRYLGGVHKDEFLGFHFKADHSVCPPYCVLAGNLGS